MSSTLINSETGLTAARELIHWLAADSTVVDFEEQMLQPNVRATLRVWNDGSSLVGFAYVDDYNNLWFDTLPIHLRLAQIESEIIAWGVSVMQQRNAASGLPESLDHACSAANTQRIAILEQHGFQLQAVRTQRYTRQLDSPVDAPTLPPGFSIRPVRGEVELDQLVALHRAAFASDHMTRDERLAMMRAPLYAPELDLLAVAPDGELAAFCVCGFEDESRMHSYTDPIGTHPRYQRLGLGKAIVLTGLERLRAAGAMAAYLGTRSDNLAMQKLAEACGFVRVSEKVWLSKPVPPVKKS